MDMQNRVGSKTGGGGQLSSSQQAASRRERLRKLALETIDLSKDPYFMRTNVGTIECKLCLTVHPNEGNYMAHTQGKRHQMNLGRRAATAASKSSESTVNALEVEAAAAAAAKRRRVTRIGKPGYNVTKTRDVKTKRRTLTFELHYPEIAGGQRPRHRFLSAFEQTIDTPADRNFQYLVFACDPYESVAFKVPNEPIDSDSVYSTYEDGGKKATLQFSFL